MNLSRRAENQIQFLQKKQQKNQLTSSNKFLTCRSLSSHGFVTLRCQMISFFLSFFFFLAALGLCCCAWAFSSCGEPGLLFLAVHRLLPVVASLVAEHGLQACGLQQLQHAGSVVVACGLQSAGSVVVAQRLSCSATCGIFLDEGSNPCPLHWQANLNDCATREVPVK